MCKITLTFLIIELVNLQTKSNQRITTRRSSTWSRTCWTATWTLRRTKTPWGRCLESTLTSLSRLIRYASL